MDACSCGVFAIAFADLLSGRSIGPKPGGFSQENLPEIRDRFYRFFRSCRM